MSRLLMLGAGYSALALGRRLLSEGWEVAGTTRDKAKAHELTEEGIVAILWPGGDPRVAFERATHLLVSVPPGAEGDPVLGEMGASLAEHAGDFDWVGYLSTTAVYGDHGGGWVDEDTPLSPDTERGRQRADAEAAWLDLHDRHGLPVHVFRLAGIYGPGRGPFAKVRDGTARRIVKEGQVFSRIHVDDIAETLRASIARPAPGTVYNVCDDEAAPPQDVIAHAADLLGRDRPPEIPFEEADLSPMARSFYGESKRVRNDRIKDALGVRLLYPTYREGLAALLAGGA